MIRRTIFIFGLLMTAAAATGFGAQITQTLTTLTVSGTGGGTWYLPQFNNSLGTLTGVLLNFGQGQIRANDGISDLENSNRINITYNLGYQVTINMPGIAPYVPNAYTALTCSGTATEVTTCSNSIQLSSALNPVTFDLSPQSGLFVFGPVGLTYQAINIQQLVGTPFPNPPTNLITSVSGSLTLPATITFIYTTPTTSTPEPSSVVLGATGLALLWVGRRWRRERI